MFASLVLVLIVLFAGYAPVSALENKLIWQPYPQKLPICVKRQDYVSGNWFWVDDKDYENHAKSFICCTYSPTDHKGDHGNSGIHNPVECFKDANGTVVYDPEPNHDGQDHNRHVSSVSHRITNERGSEFHPSFTAGGVAFAIIEMARIK